MVSIPLMYVNASSRTKPITLKLTGQVMTVPERQVPAAGRRGAEVGSVSAGRRKCLHAHGFLVGHSTGSPARL